MKANPDDLKDYYEDLDSVLRTHRDLINSDDRLRRPLLDAMNAVKVRVEDAASLPS
jgi:hypothetical protein